MSNDLSQFKQTFFTECDELLGALDEQLTALEEGDIDAERLNAVFRAIHSIKAGAGAFKFEALVRFAHTFETFLDKLRMGEVQFQDQTAPLLVRGVDIVASMVESAQEDQEPAAGLGDDVLAELETLMGQTPSGGDAANADAEAGGDANGAAPGMQRFRIEFVPKPELYRHANEPLLILRELSRLGEATVVPNIDRLPALGAMDPEDAYLDWTIELVTEAGREAVDEVFEFVTDDCTLTVTDLGAVEAPPTEVASAAEAPVADADKPADEPAATAPDGSKKAWTPVEGDRRSKPRPASIRVDLERVDRLVNMVGELVITQAMLSQQTDMLPPDEMLEIVQGVETLTMHTRELQESVMAIRMQPVKSVFSRMPRLVRDVAGQLDKQVRLEMVGEATEVDKTVIEEISDPITHMIRNSLDHGIEMPGDRLAAGKPEQATIRLSAEHRGGRIVIGIEDDGGGINRERVLAKAVERGLVAEDADLSDEEVDNLVFHPGFSTADAVTDLSGRGVGMDVVRRNIQNLGGRVQVHNMPGHGCRFTMTLPLTLAVLDGMIVSVGAEKYVLPINSITESTRPPAADLHRLANGEQVVSLRGEYIRLVHLCHVFDVPGAIQDPSKGLVVVVEDESHGVFGLVVDELLGQQQVVIKSLEDNYDPVPGISAATILGNGQVALILDVDGLSHTGMPLVGHRDMAVAETVMPPAPPAEEVQTIEA